MIKGQIGRPTQKFGTIREFCVHVMSFSDVVSISGVAAPDSAARPPLSSCSTTALNALLAMCADAVLVVDDGKYYGMRLMMPEQTEAIHPRVIVSATHKWMRQKQSKQLVFMFGCLYTAVSKDTAGDPQTGPFKGHLTRIQNRICIAVMEEGGFQFLDRHTQQQVVSCDSLASAHCNTARCGSHNLSCLLTDA